MNNTIFVSAGIVKKDGKYLISQRLPNSILCPNQWELPGGKIEFMESPEECLIREIKEELNIDITVDKLLSVNSHVYETEEKNYHVVLMTYLAKHMGGVISHKECQDSKWITLDEFKDYHFCEGDYPIIDELIKHENGNNN